MKKFILLLIILFAQQSPAQIKGNLKYHANQKIALRGFDFYDSFLLSETHIDQDGNFEIDYPKDYRGMAILTTSDNSKLILVLDSTTTELKGTHLKVTDSILFLKGKQNQEFIQIANTNLIHDRAYIGWHYLKKVYALDPLKHNKEILSSIHKEIDRIELENTKMLLNLPKESYLYWYAPLRKLISDMPQTVQNYPERIPDHIAQFRSIDFTSPNFKTSGIFKELIEGHYLLLENMGQSLDSISVQMNASTDYLLNIVKQQDHLFQKVVESLFALFEKRSLFQASSHLSQQIINNKDYGSKIHKKLQNALQKYVTLKVGNTAPDIRLSPDVNLSDIKQNTLLVFGASTCPECKKEAIELLQFHDKWVDQNTPLEVVYISLDTDKDVFYEAFKDAPWKTYSSFKGWESQEAIAYYVNATPTYILLDENRKVLLHPKSVAHVDAWIQGRF